MSKVTLEWHGDEAMTKMQQVTLETLWLAGQDAITQSMNNIPLDTGTLRRSGIVTVDSLPNPFTVYEAAQKGKGNRGETAKKGSAPISDDPLAPKVYVSFNTPYAVRLHEDLSWSPRYWKVTADGKVVPKPAVGGPKWLERALPLIKKRWSAYAARARKKVGV